MEKAHTKSRQQLKLYFSYLFFTSKTTLSVLSVHPRLRGQKVGEGTATHIGEPPKPAVLRLQTRAVTSSQHFQTTPVGHHAVHESDRARSRHVVFGERAVAFGSMGHAWVAWVASAAHSVIINWICLELNSKWIPPSTKSTIESQRSPW